MCMMRMREGCGMRNVPAQKILMDGKPMRQDHTWCKLQPFELVLNLYELYTWIYCRKSLCPRLPEVNSHI
jgi:hypothetical protein